MELLNYILAGFSMASVLGTIAASFYGVRQRTIINTLKLSNNAYAERNVQLEDELKRLREEHATKISVLSGRIDTLEKIKTPPLEPLFKLVQTNHTEVMSALRHEAAS